MSSNRRRLQYLCLPAAGCVTAFLLACASPARAEDRLTYPTASRGAVVEDYFGTAIRRSVPLARRPRFSATRTWVAAEAKLTEAILASNPARARIRAARCGAV